MEEDRVPLLEQYEATGNNERREEKEKVRPYYDIRTLKQEGQNNSENDKCKNVLTQIFKLIVYVLLFVIVLVSAMIAKGTLLFMTSQIKPNTTTPYCDKFHSDLESYQAVLNLQEQSQWIWVLFFAFITPEFFTLFRSVRLITFKKFRKPNLEEFLMVGLFETLHTIGVGMLVFIVLPELDVIKGLMLTNCVCLIPGLLLMLSRSRPIDDKPEPMATSTLIFYLICDAFAILAQLSGLVTFSALDYQHLNNAVWAIPTAIFLISFAWWENFVIDKSPFKIMQYLEEKKRKLDKTRTRYFIYAFVSIWKMITFFFCMVGFVYLNFDQSRNNDTFFLFKYFLTTDSYNVSIGPSNVSNTIYINTHLDGSTSVITPSSSTTSDSYTIFADGSTALWVWGIHIAAGYMCYITSKFACRVQMQEFSFSIPITLTVPAVISFLIAACGMKDADVCYLKNVIPPYLFWDCPPQEFYIHFGTNTYAWIWFFWFISQVWITYHIWKPNCERLASTEKIFGTPMYADTLIDQSVILNRRRDDEQTDLEENVLYETIIERKSERKSKVDPEDPGNELQLPKSLDTLTIIKACITMWHEKAEEMMGTIKSIMKLDQDQAFRRLARKTLKITDNDYYKLEVHIFIDDAFAYSRDLKQYVLNKYVIQFIEVMDKAWRTTYSPELVQNLTQEPPKKYNTPYGGRLVYTLLGGNMLYVHLKDKNKIRHRKRWSQVMYMYYLLGIRLNSLMLGEVGERSEQATKDQAARVDVKAANTYILALDGDISFEPKAVLLLVDLMKKNPKLGAACGRIHPVGSGVIAWYQKFEYAIGHWLQKATEHVIGCVLCSPGCFSLFRGQALMAKNTMFKYTTKASKAQHHVQYDQGEDRWLCTLLLQQGYRVEYAAASDAFTHCPETFEEFYKQRRRWVPSTMANIIDLLFSAKLTVKANDDISFIYIIYQMVLLGSSVIGPGTIFLMVVGAMVSAFGVDLWTSLWINTIPLLLFILVCFWFKQDTQIKVAGVLTCLYALVMMAVLVGIFLEIAAEGWLAPSSFFLIITAGLMILTGMLHPMEIECLFCGVIYWVVIPSMYLLLIIFSTMNMNDVSWGVREDPTADANEEQAQAEIAQQARNAKSKSKFSKTMKSFGLNNKNGGYVDDGYFNLSCGDCFRINCCNQSKPSNEECESMVSLDTDSEYYTKAEITEQPIKIPRAKVQPSRTQHGPSTSKHYYCNNPEDGNCAYYNVNSATTSIAESHQESADYEEKPFWIDNTRFENSDCKLGEQNYLTSKEEAAWKYIIKNFLSPEKLKSQQTKEEKDEQVKIIAELKTLRNQVVFTFFMLNSLFVVTVFLMQLHQDTIYIEYPDIGHVNITWIPEEQEVKIVKEMLRIEPIGLVFILVFALILILQFIAMLFHRFGTLALILSTTTISMCSNQAAKNKARSEQNDAIHVKNGETGRRIVAEIMRKKLKQNATDEDECEESAWGQYGIRNTAYTLVSEQQQKQQKPSCHSIEDVFSQRLQDSDKRTLVSMEAKFPDREDRLKWRKKSVHWKSGYKEPAHITPSENKNDSDSESEINTCITQQVKAIIHAENSH